MTMNRTTTRRRKKTTNAILRIWSSLTCSVMRYRTPAVGRITNTRCTISLLRRCQTGQFTWEEEVASIIMAGQEGCLLSLTMGVNLECPRTLDILQGLLRFQWWLQVLSILTLTISIPCRTKENFRVRWLNLTWTRCTKIQTTWSLLTHRWPKLIQLGTIPSPTTTLRLYLHSFDLTSSIVQGAFATTTWGWSTYFCLLQAGQQDLNHEAEESEKECDAWPWQEQHDTQQVFPPLQTCKPTPLFNSWS